MASNTTDPSNGGLPNQAYVPDEDDINLGKVPKCTDPSYTQSNEFYISEPTDRQPNQSQECSLCGLISLPKGLQKFFLKAPWLLVFLCWASSIQGMTINGLINVVVSSLERRFGLTSATAGIIAGSYDLGSLISVIPITYFGGRLGSSKARYISVGLFLMGLGSFIFLLPHFITGPYLANMSKVSIQILQENSTISSDLCSSGYFPDHASEVHCSEEAAAALALEGLSRFKWMFFLGQFIHGIGAAPLITLGTTLLDQSVSKTSSPLYIGIFQTFFVVGPAIGFMAGGLFLDTYTDYHLYDVVEVFHLTPESPLWVGAWWLGFVITCAMAWTCALIVSCYPAVLPGSEHHMDVKASDGFTKTKELPKAIVCLLKNPTYMFINFGSAMDSFVLAAMSTFMPKFIHSQYGLTTGSSSFITGLILVPAGGLGTFFGGFITKRMRLTRAGVIKLFMYCQLITVPCLLGLFLYCPSVPFAGVNVPYENGAEAITLEDACNRECNCKPVDYNPVCGNNAVQYLNPCYAGCLNAVDDSVMSDCLCINATSTPQAKKGTCEQECNLFPYFAVTMFFSIWFTFMGAMPNVVATLRSVEPVHKSLALGIESIFVRVLGSIPGPILFGYLFDSTCVLWQERDSSCDSKSCLSMIKLLSVVFFGLALWFSGRSPVPDDLPSQSSADDQDDENRADEEEAAR